MTIDDPADPASVYLSEADVAILAGVIGHPFRLPTLRELQFAAGEFDRPLVGRRVDRLVEQGILEVVEFDGTGPGTDSPDAFYGTTSFGETVLERRVPPARARTIAEQYARLEKPPGIRRLERAPRPSR